MPVRCSKDSEGCYCSWGKQGRKYYYTCGNDEDRRKAQKKARKEGEGKDDKSKESESKSDE